MKGFVYLSLENTLHYKPHDCIIEDPGFFIRNKHLIQKHWFFDNENEATRYYDMLKHFVEVRKVSSSSMRDFLSSIGDLRYTPPPPLPKNQVSVAKSNED